MTILTKEGGVYKDDADKLFQRINGVYVEVDEMHQRINGSYMVIFPNGGSTPAEDFPDLLPGQIEFGYRPSKIDVITTSDYWGRDITWILNPSGSVANFANTLNNVSHLSEVNKVTTLSKLRMASVTQNEDIKLGLYVWDGTKPTTLKHTFDFRIGSVTTSPQWFEVDVSALALTLDPGVEYCIAFETENLELPESPCGDGFIRYPSTGFGLDADLSSVTGTSTYNYVTPVSIVVDVV